MRMQEANSPPSSPALSLSRRLRARLEVWGVRLAFALLPWTPRVGIQALATVAGSLFYWLDARSRRVALSNLEAAFGDQYSPTDRCRIARRSACHFALTFFDLFWARRLTAANLERYVVFEHLETLQQHHQHGGVIGISIHYGAYELAAYACGFRGIQATMLARDFKNPGVTALFTAAREGSGHTIIPREKALRRMLGCLRAGQTVGVMVDLALKIHEGGFALDCFGLKMNSTAVHGALHLRTGRPVIPISNRPLPDGRRLIRLHPPLVFPRDADAEQVAQCCWDFFEAEIRAEPERWLWCYRHFRYRPAGADRQYPFYAHPAVEFDERVAAREGLAPGKNLPAPGPSA